MRRTGREIPKAPILRRTPALAVLALALFPVAARAGPPYLTDDPDPVAYHHWELYLASQWDHIDRHAASGSLPHLEVNFGAADGTMLHLLVPAAYLTSAEDGATYGLSDMELGANIRLVEEGPGRPQVGTFPIVTLPTGSEDRGLGSGQVEVFLPVWLMKTMGPWTFDGGGGLHIANKDLDAELGAFVQRSLGDLISLGAEAFVTIPFDDASAIRTQLDLALILDLTATHHLLFSGGPSFGATKGAQAYAAWLVTL